MGAHLDCLTSASASASMSASASVPAAVAAVLETKNLNPTTKKKLFLTEKKLFWLQPIFFSKMLLHFFS